MRRFLTRVEATGLLGLGCASQVNSGRVKPPAEADLRLACRAAGEIHEADFGEVLHAQIQLRVGGDLEAGWTVDAAWYARMTTPCSECGKVGAAHGDSHEWVSRTTPAHGGGSTFRGFRAQGGRSRR